MGAKPRHAPATRAVAFLRGMNLGRRRITNDELRAVFQSMGFRDVDLFLASGNVIFDTGGRRDLETYIAAGLRDALDYDVPTYVRTAEEVRAIAESAPFTEAELAASSGKVQVIFIPDVPSAGTRRTVADLSTADDLLRLGQREIYWLPIGNMSASELDLRAIERATGGTTIRTKRTIDRICAKYLA